jgi:hypothetical protein
MSPERDPLRFGCMDCGAMRPEPGSCTVCEAPGALLDLNDAQVRSTLIQNDDERAQRHERRLYGAGIGVGLLVVVGLMAVSDVIAMAMMSMYFGTMIVSCILIAVSFAQIALRVRPARRLFPMLRR